MEEDRNKEILKQALLEIRRLKQENKEKNDKVAVIGMACKFPGGIKNTNDFWEFLSEGKCAIEEMSEQRKKAYHFEKNDLPYLQRAGYLTEDIEEFDASLFHISPREAAELDPQHRLFLKVCWEALENAGYAPDKLENTKIGVYAGIVNEDYLKMLDKDKQYEYDPTKLTGNLFSFLSGRVSYIFGLNGPSITIDTACSSSLVAIAQAYKDILLGECDMALVGGTNILYSPETTNLLSELNILSPTCQVNTFDANANGTVRGEGCGGVVLKSFTNAKKDHDTIQAIIRGECVNQDGPSTSITAPLGLSQEKLLHTAWERSGIVPSQIGYIETHGTGTKMGDPIEVESIKNQLGDLEKPVFLGSVKANIGHLEPAAGIASFIKTVLMLQNKTIVKQVNYNTPSPYIDWTNENICVPMENMEWKSTGTRIAGISSFGLSGTNAHIVLEEYCCEDVPVKEKQERENYFIKFSGETQDAIQKQFAEWSSFLEDKKDNELQGIAQLQNSSKADLTYRAIVWGKDITSLKANMTDYLNKNRSCSVVIGKKKRKIVFLFTGQGSQYPNMTKDLYDINASYRYYMNQCNEIYKKYEKEDLLELIFSENSQIDDTKYTQPALFMVEYSMAKMWEEYGISPDVLLGHSIGEYVAATLAGVFSKEDAMKLVIARGNLMSNKTDVGMMVAVRCGRDEILKYLGNETLVSIAASNTYNQTVISGDCNRVESICKKLTEDTIPYKKLNVCRAFHSPLMNPILEEFQQVASQVTYHSPNALIISNLTGKEAGKELTNSKYWSEHIHSEVKFCESIKNLGELEQYIFLEVGPKPILSAAVRQIADGDYMTECLATYYSRHEVISQIEECIVGLYVNGHSIDWNKYYEKAYHYRGWIPNYCFSEKHYSCFESGQKKIVYEEDKVTTEQTLVIEDELHAQQYVTELLKEELKVSVDELEPDTNLIVLGLNSIIMGHIASTLQKELSIKIRFSDYLENCTITQWANLILQASPNVETNEETQMLNTTNQKIRKLNQIQEAYWSGQNDSMEWGGVSCSAIYESASMELDIEKFIEVLQRMMACHEMLRCVITDDGKQKILEIEETPIPIKIYKQSDVIDRENHFKTLYQQWNGHKAEPNELLYQIALTQLEDTKWTLSFYVDFIAFDALSVQLFWRDMNQLYLGNSLKELKCSYFDYLNHIENYRDEKQYQIAQNYWEQKIDSFPEPAELPYNHTNLTNLSGKFVSRKRILSLDKWNVFCDKAALVGLTPSGALLSLYSEVLSAWGGGSSFAIMLTVFRRELVHPDVEHLIGDFTRLALVEITRQNATVVQNAKTIQKQMQNDISYSEYSAIDFVKCLRKNDPEKNLYPIVFTSAIGLENISNLEKNIFADNLYSISSTTPQVFLDHQVFREKDGIAISWDSVDEAFYPGVIDSMYEVYNALIDRAIGEEDFFNTTLTDLRPTRQIITHNKVNQTEQLIPDKTLLDGYFNHVKYTPDKAAIIWNGETCTYKELSEKANQVSNMLLNYHVTTGDFIGVQIEKSIHQIAVILGILQVGAVYVPILHNNPVDKTNQMIKQAHMQVVVCGTGMTGVLDCKHQLASEESNSYSENFDRREIDPKSTAYVIFTSGSTGTPKGVVIPHRGAMNTIQDVLDRNDITDKDKVIALSAINFDLSVFDVFGMLTVGGTLVMPTEAERIEPSAWVQLVKQYGVSVWNSVPSILGLFVEYLEKKNQVEQTSTLRKVILSGDWIPLELYGRLKKVVPDVDLISMGGATECSIWSNYYEVTEIEPSWKSIPYGYPLANQEFYVLDKFGRSCPDWVRGQLNIAGTGVATGYLNNKELTEHSFYQHDGIGKRLYQTGDYGRYMQEGVIEFLGRNDGQVKINGFRIELGDIKVAFHKAGIKEEPIIEVIGEQMEAKKLVAFIQENQTERNEIQLKKDLKNYIPGYLLPDKIIFVEKIPVTNNGKINHKKLKEMCNSDNVTKTTMKKQHSSKVVDILKRLYNLTEINEEESFESLGLSSIDMIRFANELELEFKHRPSVTEILSYDTIGSLSEYYGEENSDTATDETQELQKERLYYSILSKEQQKYLLNYNNKNYGEEEYCTELTTYDPCTLEKMIVEHSIKTIDELPYALIARCKKHLKDVTMSELGIAIDVPAHCTKEDRAGIYCISSSDDKIRLVKEQTENSDNTIKIYLFADLLNRTLKETKMNIHKWISNCYKIIDSIKSDNMDIPCGFSFLSDKEEQEWPLQYYHLATIECKLDERYFGVDEESTKQVVELLDKMQQKDIRVWLEDDKLLYQASKKAMTLDIRNEIKAMKFKIINYFMSKERGIQQDVFPQTPLQRAYVLGRNKAFELGNTSAHYYIEFNVPNLQINHFNDSVNQIIDAQAMLRTVVQEDGTQKIIHMDKPYQVTITDKNVSLQEVRALLSHQEFELGHWPMFHIQITPMEDNHSILHLSFDCTIMDGWSTELFMKNLFECYQNKPIEKPAFSFKEYMLTEKSWIKSHSNTNQNYWIERAPSLPLAPSLPTICSFNEVTKPMFHRKSVELSEKYTTILLNKMKEHNFTSSAVLCTAYMKVLSYWANQPELTLNVTLFGRLPIHKDVMSIIGDFTNIALIPYKRDGKDSFIHEIQCIQDLFWEAIDHRNASGLEALKILGKDKKGKAVMPVIFTSELFGDAKQSQFIPDDVQEVYAISQTPQVSLDHQALLRNGKMELIWDYVAELFDDEEIEGKFEIYKQVILSLVYEEDWNISDEQFFKKEV